MDNRRSSGARATLVVLAVTVALMTGCGDDSDTATSADAGASREKNTVVLRDILFKPDKIQVEAGDTVTWKFEDKGIPHDVTAEDKSFKSETMDSGTFQHAFDTPGTYEYLCSLHPAQMKGVIEVR